MTSPPISHEVTRLLKDWGNGDQAALDRLMPLVDRELRRLARHYLGRERTGQTFQTADLINEAYLRLVGQRRVCWQNRAHFYGLTAQLMRRILVDRARHRRRVKRGGGTQVLALEEAATISAQPEVDLLALDEALCKLSEVDRRKAKIVELRFFGGLSVEEAAHFLNVSPVTVMREWKMAKAWLHRVLSDDS
jgi:RNA polymerase sigma factor (TIGR02999 family)